MTPGPPAELIDLQHLIEADLDEVSGGIGWWVDHLDRKQRSVQGDYLVTSLRGIHTAMRAAVTESERHRKALFADGYWVRGWWKANRLGALPERDDQAKRRDVDIRVAHEATIYHLAQALDRLAAAVSLTAGLADDARRMDWGKIEQAATRLDRSPATDDAHLLQARAVAGVRSADAHGPTDWLPWLRQTRNTHVHRAVRDEPQVLAGDPDRGTHRIVRAFYRQPDLHAVEAIGASVIDMEEVFIVQDTDGLLAGLTDSTRALVAQVCSDLAYVWLQRRANPDLIRQPASAWPPRKKEPALAFAGYGPEVPWRRGAVNMHPRDARRWNAAGLTDDRRADWRA